MGRDGGVDAAVGEDVHPALEQGDEDEDAGLVAGMMQAVFNEGDQRPLFDFGGNFRLRNESALEGGEKGEQPFAGEKKKQVEGDEDPLGVVAEGPGEQGGAAHGEEAGADQFGARIIVGGIDHHRHDFAAGAHFRLPHRRLDALFFLTR